MADRVGNAIIGGSERADQATRSGMIVEVLQEQPLRFRVRREDGRETIFSPAAGVAPIEPAGPPQARARIWLGSHSLSACHGRESRLSAAALTPAVDARPHQGRGAARRPSPPASPTRPH
jgi:hypothetical protein